jgi:hypothetical protein
MNRICAMAGVLLAAAHAAQATTIKLDSSIYSFSNGGEFTATVMSGNAGLTGGLNSMTADSFQTFCLEYHEHFSPGNLYTAVLNTAANSASQGLDPVDARTAYLYTKYRQGTLSGFDYSTVAGRKNSAGQLQLAIWYLEDESNGANNSFVGLANTAVAVGGEWYGRGLADVRAMNLYNPDGSYAQDQLTLVTPVPHAAVAGLAGLCGVGGLVWMRRRSHASA